MVTLTSVAVSSQRFVHRIVDDFVDQVMQTVLGGGADVHRRPQPHCFQAFQHFDATGIVNFDRSHFFCCHVVKLDPFRLSADRLTQRLMPQMRMGITT